MYANTISNLVGWSVSQFVCFILTRRNYFTHADEVRHFRFQLLKFLDFSDSFI